MTERESSITRALFLVFVCLSLFFTFFFCDSKNMRCLFSWIVCPYNWRVTSSSLRHPCCLSFNLPPWKQQKKKNLVKKKFNFSFTSTQKLKFYNSLIFSRWPNKNVVVFYIIRLLRFVYVTQIRWWNGVDDDKTIRFFFFGRRVNKKKNSKNLL